MINYNDELYRLIKLKNIESFMSKILTPDILENIEFIEKSPYIIKFSSPTCAPCNSMKPVMEAFRKEKPDFIIYEVDTQESPEIASYFNIRSVPTIHICEKRDILYSFHGLTPLRDLLYVVNNLNDKTFIETGSFSVEKKTKSYFYEFIIGFLVLTFVLLFVFL
jgi:thioredoxin 1